MLKVLEATLSYFKQWLKVLKMGIFSSDCRIYSWLASDPIWDSNTTRNITDFQCRIWMLGPFLLGKLMLWWTKLMLWWTWWSPLVQFRGCHRHPMLFSDLPKSRTMELHHNINGDGMGSHIQVNIMEVMRAICYRELHSHF